MEREKISVCMATYNGEKYLKEQIETILNQLNHKDELVISDDASTDRTIQIILSFRDKRIRLIRNSSHNGIKKNFENAIISSTGKYIFLSDQDDVWINNKIVKMVEKLKTYDSVISDAYITDEKLNVISNSLLKKENIKNGITRNILKNGYYGCCLAFNRTLLSKILPFPENTNEVTHDLWIGLIAETYGQMFILREPLIYFRRHERTVTNIGTKKKGRRFLKKINGRIEIIKIYIKKIKEMKR